MKKKKIIIPISSYPTRNRELKKNSKKIQKIKKHHYDFISSQTESREAKKEREKKLSFWQVPNRPGIENSKKIAKKLKNIIMASSQAKNRLGEAEKEKKKIIVPIGT